MQEETFNNFLLPQIVMYIGTTLLLLTWGYPLLCATPYYVLVLTQTYLQKGKHKNKFAFLRTKFMGLLVA